ncbi:BgTH12-00884 [Blumeria graminis f. sp. triticale]|uniref:Bgt-51489 n=2 Tax=Blumeria graminis TaxID=34373 RepID=A0A9X9MMT4_BLUGR|nr:BgTH12-00884 [Blumeria graminis f. sp. triticale]VDB93468.1 Bgt-51489 [Blumeria graminis f. sp. tritici]
MDASAYCSGGLVSATPRILMPDSTYRRLR